MNKGSTVEWHALGGPFDSHTSSKALEKNILIMIRYGTPLSVSVKDDTPL